MTEPIRVGVIGCGRMGQRRLKTARANPRAAVIGCADADPDLARRVAESIDCRAYADSAALVADPAIDCVIVSTPNKFHLDAALAALAAGKHVFLEKPLSRDPAEGRAIVEAALQHGRFLKVGSNLRYFPSVLKAKDLIDTGAVGEPLFLRGWVGNNGWQLDSWFKDAEQIGGGAFLDNGCHLLDIARWLLGEVTECTGFVSTSHWPVGPLEDLGMGVFRFAGGQLATVQASWTEWQEYNFFEVYGRDGLVRVDNRMPHCTTTVRSRAGAETVWDYSDEPPTSFPAEMDDFLAALVAGRQPAPSGLDGLRAVQMSHGLYEASRTGRTVSLWEESDRALARRHGEPEVRRD